MDLHRSTLLQTDQAVDKHFNRENCKFHADALHVHGIIKCMHFLVSWYTALFIHPSNCEKISPFVRCLAMNNYDSFTWTVDTPPKKAGQYLSRPKFRATQNLTRDPRSKV
ncbi:hypothetical protein CK203_097061 [Vitis vinifera]|uniref:Uncharacterized protein n=1 Tax=Vitis vinifera TaxID=29760 RepID=A0A438FJS2_VITVI|nr:hypothetical protein CK203_097061 [Vitis vinifera]